MRAPRRHGATNLAVVLGALSAVCFKGVVETAAAQPADSSQSRPFTVADGIEMTRVAEPGSTLFPYEYHRFEVSPDGQHFILVTWRGDLKADENEYRLLLYDTAQVRQFVNSPAQRDLPKPVTLATFHTSSNYRAIEQARWLNNETVTFIGRGENNMGEIYTIDIATRALRQVSFRADTFMGVMTYDFLPSGVAVYSAAVTPDWAERNKWGYVVGNLNIQNLTIRDSKDSPYLDDGFFLLKAQSHKAQLLPIPFLTDFRERGSLPHVPDIALSPNGCWAVLIGGVRHPPITWSKYPFVQGYRRQLASSCGKDCVPMDDREMLESLTPQEPTAPRSSWMLQYYLVDVADGTVSPLLDAPTGFVEEPPHIVWSADSRRVFVSPTLLPLAGDRRAQPGEAQAAVVVEVPSKRASFVTDQYVSAISDAEWQSGDLALEWRTSADAPIVRKRFRRHATEWSDVPTTSAKSSALILDMREDMNTPPDIEATDPRTGRGRAITDLNPQFRDVSLGHVEAFRWKDRLQRTYVGGLVLPPDFKRGHRYPVVLQTYGFFPSEFLVDGPQDMSTAYAARALAGRGMVVLQMPQRDTGKRLGRSIQPWTYENDGENPRFLAMTEGAIAALNREGLIDRHRVGLIGFSHEGMHVQYAITFSKYPIAAATIADSIQMGPMTYYLLYGNPYPAGMLSMEGKDMLGVPLWGAGVRQWVDRAPSFHTDRIRSPLRIEHHGTHVPCTWATFVSLKHHRRPVEMIHLPDNAHILERPLARYVSEEGDVDWFAFWLKGEESADPSKQAQYKRWEALRVLRDCVGCRQGSSAAMDRSGDRARVLN
jgi:hypothetical protein